jgi:D-alanyl-D-alanine dipeptidase
MYGYATRVYALPDARLGVAVVDDMDATNNVVDRVGEYALALLLADRAGRPLPDFEVLDAVDPERARTLEGRYEEGPRTLELVERGGDLFLFNGTEEHRLRQRGDTLVVDDRLAHGYTLLPDGDRLVEAGGAVFQRADSVQVPTAIDPALKGLIGEYGWDHNTLYILERDGGLWALIEWFFYYPLTHVEGNVYAFPADQGLYMGETLTFKRDARGRATEADLGGVVFERRAVGPEEGNTFKINPLRPAEELRAEALAATPPEEEGDFLEPDLLELTALDPSIRLDIRYATTNNFMGTVFYKEARAFLQRPAAEAVVRVHQALAEHGLGLVIYDGYRPWYVTKMFWEATPIEMRDFVADPANGSRHNRGCAVDLGLFDLETGEVVPMPSGYDEFTARAYADYPGGTERARWHRELLRNAMEQEGFTVYPFEWWHYDYQDWRSYPIMNMTFEALD